MKLCIRAHDLGVQGTGPILSRMQDLGLDGVQLVCYKVYEEIPYIPGAITAPKAEEIGKAFSAAGVEIPMLGAYFNPMEPDTAKEQSCEQIFADYLRLCPQFGSAAVGSETGYFYKDGKILFHQNRTEQAFQSAVEVFSRLCDVGADFGSQVVMEGSYCHTCYDVPTLAKARRVMGRSNTRVAFDLYNFMDEANQGDYLHILDQGLDTFGTEILLFHIKDCILTNGRPPEQVNFGAGDLNVPAILKRIKASNPEAVLVLEGTTGEGIAPAVKLLRETWQQL